MKGTRKSIGGFQNRDICFENHTIELPKNSVIYASTDGFPDQHNVERKKFGKVRLEKLLADIVHLPFATQQQMLQDQLQEQMKGTDQRDDVLLLGFKI